MLLGYVYVRNNLVRLRGYPTQRDIADISNLLCFHSVFMRSKKMTRLPKSHPLKRNGMNKNRYKHFRQPVEMKIMQMCMYQFKLTKS